MHRLTPPIAPTQPSPALGIGQLVRIDDDVLDGQQIQRRILVGKDAWPHFSIGTHGREAR